MTDKTELIELYKIVVNTITANEQRRQQGNAVYLSMVAAGMAAIGGIKNFDPVYLALPALPISLIWFASVRYFRQLARAKFRVIGEIEKNFSIRPFELEWQHFKSSTDGNLRLPKWLRLRFGLTHLEMCVPAFLAAASALYLMSRAFGLTAG